MIITLTPFPSIEYIYSVEELALGQSIPSKNVSLNILSKGVYSAQMMKVLQEEPLIISACGGFAGKSIKHYLDKGKIKSDLVWTEYETPHRVKIILEHTLEGYTLLSSEAHTLQYELERLNYKLKQHIHKVSTLILSGQLPEGHPAQSFKMWIDLAKHHNVKTIVSTGQKAVWETTLQARPYAIFLTEDQIKSIGLMQEVTYEACVAQLAPLLGNGIHYMCVYLKNRGALILSKQQYCLVQSTMHLINPNNTATSGAFLGTLAVCISRQYQQEKTAKLCLAAALAADDNVMHKICKRKEVEYRYKKTKVTLLPKT